MGPGFSERMFEFCYNAEYCQLNAAMLATHPHIPSQRLEKYLGYDVEFRLTHERYTRSVFLQHKVSSFAEVRAGKNAKFYDTHGAAYFRFPVNNEQHNVLCDLSRSKGDAFYCAPKFYLPRQLEANFRTSSIGENSILLNPLDVGEIPDAETHNITYDTNGLNPTLHSDPRSFKRAFGGGKQNAPQLKRLPIADEYINLLSEDLLRRAKESKFKSHITTEIERLTSIEKAQFVLGRIYEVTWLLLP
jgi:hypothetical protein